MFASKEWVKDLMSKVLKKNNEKINESLEWKLAGSETGNNAISLPTKFNELNIVVTTRNSSNFTIHVTKEALTSSGQNFFSGMPLGSTWYGVRVTISLTEAILTLSNDNVGNYIEDSVTKVYYK